jgi:tetratricopeptide (TPR) repeat protein
MAAHADPSPAAPAAPPAAGSRPTPAVSETGLIDPSVPASPAFDPTLSAPAAPATATHVTAAAGPRERPALPVIPGYEIDGEVGAGGMGLVYKARHLALDRVVALKMVLAGAHARAKDLERFRAEAQAVARLQHPNIVQVYEVGEAGGLPYISLEFVPGGTLAKKSGHEPQPPAAAARTVEALARAVQYAHERGIVHRDLKPANVMLADDGTPKVTDFGLAKRLEADSGQTQTGQILGTPSYMAPEQAGGDTAKVGPAADVYALGAILYDLLTGRPPFTGSSVLDTLEMVRTREPVPPGQLAGKLPRDLETITLKCLQKDPARRYPSACELADDLRCFLDGRPIVARPVGSVERAWRWAKRNPWLAGLGASVALLLIAVAVVTSVLLWRLSLKHDEAERNLHQAEANQKAAEEATGKALAEKKNAEIATEDQKKARKVTAEQREVALNTIRNILVRVDEVMKKDAKLAPLRVQIIHTMLEDLDKVRDTAVKNPLEDRTEAIAFSRMGEIYFMGNRIQEAEVWTGKAYKVLKQLADEHPAEPQYLRNFAACGVQLAEVEYRLGNGTKALRLFEFALALRKKRVELVGQGGTEMEQADAAMDVAESLNLLAFNELRLGRVPQAIEHYVAADNAYAALPPPLPNFLKVKRTRTDIQSRLGDAYGREGNAEAAERAFRAALKAGEEQLSAAPRGQPSMIVTLRTDVGIERMYLGDFQLMVRKDAVKAWPEFEAAMQLFAEDLARTPDSLDLQQRVAAMHYRFGIAAEKRPDAALAAGGLATAGLSVNHYGRSYEMRVALAKIDSKDSQGQIELLLSEARTGQLSDAGRTAQRLIDLKEGYVLFQVICGLSVASERAGPDAEKFRTQALEVLGKMIDNGWSDRGSLLHDPDLDALRADKRFAEYLARIPERGN